MSKNRRQVFGAPTGYFKDGGRGGRQGWTIVAGLARGSTRRLSDAEFRRRMDPRGHYEAQMVSVLSDIRDALEDGRDKPERRSIYKESRQTAPQNNQRGGVQLS